MPIHPTQQTPPQNESCSFFTTYSVMNALFLRSWEAEQQRPQWRFVLPCSWRGFHTRSFHLSIARSVSSVHYRRVAGAWATAQQRAQQCKTPQIPEDLKKHSWARKSALQTWESGNQHSFGYSWDEWPDFCLRFRNRLICISNSTFQTMQKCKKVYPIYFLYKSHRLNPKLL